MEHITHSRRAAVRDDCTKDTCPASASICEHIQHHLEAYILAPADHLRWVRARLPPEHGLRHRLCNIGHHLLLAGPRVEEMEALQLFARRRVYHGGWRYVGLGLILLIYTDASTQDTSAG